MKSEKIGRARLEGRTKEIASIEGVRMARSVGLEVMIVVAWYL